MIKNNRDKGYGVRYDDNELIDIGKAKKILDERNRKKLEHEKLEKEIEGWM
jgi:hypothetical protein